MKKISFAKMSGAGNDFILFDRKFNPDIKLNPAVIKRLCTRRTGIGADGIIIISDHNDYDYNMEYYNADGSTGSLCGNGARCSIKYGHLSGRFHSGKAKFLSNGLEYSGEVIDAELIKFNLNEPRNLNLDMNIQIDGEKINCSFIDTGSPHVVIFTDDIQKENLDDVPVFASGRQIRHLKDFQPGGTNVNFIKIIDGKVHIRTYERGVEDETLACGTGSTAAAIISFLKEKIDKPVTLITRSGHSLIVDFNVSGHTVCDVSLTGPADITFTGEFYSNLYFNNTET